MNRIVPKLPAAAFQTYTISSPHDRLVKTACEQVACEAWRHGWDTAIDESTEFGQRQAAYIRTQSGRTFRELPRAGAVSLTVFRFDSGQRCFADHQTRPESYGVLGGDWRQYTGTIRRHTRAADWVEDFGEHQKNIADQQERG